MLDSNCQECGLYRNTTKIVGPFGAEVPILTLVGMAPGREEDKAGIPFVGPSGKLLDGALIRTFSKAGAPLIELRRGLRKKFIRLVNAIWCLPPGNKVLPIHLESCSFRARNDLRTFPPGAAIALGEVAVKALWPEAPKGALGLSMSALKGEVVPFRLGDQESVPVIITWHPSYLVRRGGAASDEYQEWLWDFEKALKVAQDWEDPVKRYIPEHPDYQFEFLQTHYQQRQFWEWFFQQKPPLIALDWETEGFDPYSTGRIVTVAIALPDRCVVIPLWWPGFEPAQETIEGLARLLERPFTNFVAHNLSFEIRWLAFNLARYGLKHSDPDRYALEVTKNILKHHVDFFHDTMLLEYLRKETRGKSLKIAVWRAFGLGDWSIEVKNITSRPLEEVAQYNAMDAIYTKALFSYYLDTLDPDLFLPYENILRPATIAFVIANFRGIPVDRQRYEELCDKWKDEVENKRQIIKALAPDLNPNSPVQLKNLFYVQKGYTPVIDEGRTVRFLQPGEEPSKVTTNEEALKLLTQEYDDPLPQAIIDYRHAAKVWTTYLRDTHKRFFIKTSGLTVLRPNFGLVFTDTGRTNCQDPNIQNWPKRQIKEIRDAVGVRELEELTGREWVIVSCDQGQIEARLFALVSADENFLYALFHGLDIHRFFTKLLFQITQGTEEDMEEDEEILSLLKRFRIKKLEVVDKKTFKDFRSIAKNGFTFPCLYTAGIETMRLALSKKKPISAELVALAREILFSKYPKIKEFIDSQLRLYKEQGFLRSLFWRRRRAPIPYSARINFIIQSSASDITLCSGIELCKWFPWIIFVHDDNTFLLPKDDKFDQRVDTIIKTMIALPWVYLKDAPKYLLKAWIPFSVEVEVGKNWGSLEGYKEVDAYRDLGLQSIEDSLALWEEISPTLPELSIELPI